MSYLLEFNVLCKTWCQSAYVAVYGRGDLKVQFPENWKREIKLLILNVISFESAKPDYHFS